MSKPKVLIGTPISKLKEYCIHDYLKAIKDLTYENKELVLLDNSPDNELFEKLQKELENEKHVRIIKTDFVESIREMLTRDRNKLRQIALDENFDYFLSLDQDLIPPKDIIERLIRHNKKVVCGLYFGFSHTEKIEEKANYYVWSNPKMKEIELYKQLNLEDLFPSRLIQIYGGGDGCTLIHKDVLKKIEFYYKKEINTFSDAYFYKDCKKNGFEIFLDSSVICKHLIESYDENMKKMLWNK